MSYIPVVFVGGVCAGLLVAVIALAAWMIRNQPRL